jgi:hypothetical protein
VEAGLEILCGNQQVDGISFVGIVSSRGGNKEMSVLSVMRLRWDAAYLVSHLQPSPRNWVTLDGDFEAESRNAHVLRYVEKNRVYGRKDLELT